MSTYVAPPRGPSRQRQARRAQQDGAQAFRSGLPIASNPHPARTWPAYAAAWVPQRWWDDGWRLARRGRLSAAALSCRVPLAPGGST